MNHERNNKSHELKGDRPVIITWQVRELTECRQCECEHFSPNLEIKL